MNERRDGCMCYPGAAEPCPACRSVAAGIRATESATQEFQIQCSRERMAAKAQLTDDYVAWLTFRKKDGTHSDGRIRICDSDSPGAFKVYRAAPISISAVIESIDDLDVWMQTQQENHRLRDALVACVAVAKAWHAADDVWEIYYNHSPEMKPIRDVLGPLP